MKLKSKTLSNVLKILLWVLAGFACADLVSSIVYTASLDAFTAYIYDFYGFVEIVSSVLYYIAAVVYLIWIYCVHLDMKAIFPSFARSPGKALACILIPVYNLFGIPSIYRMIGRSYLEETDGAKKEGRWICSLALPLLLFMMISNGLGRMVNQADELSGSMILILSLVTLILYMCFLILCIQVSRGLHIARLEIFSRQSNDFNAGDFEETTVGQPTAAH
ncbi:DUF4328 domain-containing protein [Paenibacillus sp. BK720]|uniref:DUF4328 domain-containing protein n=1 Tax=Paenibacillus sp. BK720 TaxID=2587092 RepID=UPI00141E2EA8|nr:DUF4328 domain-containing protein [Paenibacillus sp. BK720]NIK68213.1 hypothetical protein [Paenibacillus sp. BK720]